MIYISVILNIFLLTVLFIVSKRALDVYSRIDESFGAVESFREHLEIVYNLDTFYGDDTLGSLLEHSKELSSFLGEMQEAEEIQEIEEDAPTTQEEE